MRLTGSVVRFKTLNTNFEVTGEHNLTLVNVKLHLPLVPNHQEHQYLSVNFDLVPGCQQLRKV